LADSSWNVQTAQAGLEGRLNSHDIFRQRFKMKISFKACLICVLVCGAALASAQNEADAGMASCKSPHCCRSFVATAP
jgi:hypothetical protein